MPSNNRRHTAQDVGQLARQPEVRQRGMVRRTQSEMVPSSVGTYAAHGHHNPPTALVSGLYQGGVVDPSAEASHTSNIAGVGNMQSSTISSKQVYSPTVVHKTEDNQDHSKTITKHKTKTQSTTRNKVVVNVQNLYLQGQSTSGTSLITGIPSLENIFSPDILSTSHTALPSDLTEHTPRFTESIKSSAPHSPPLLQGSSERKSSKDKSFAQCRLQMMHIISREEPLNLNTTLVEGVASVGAVIAVIKDSGRKKIGVIERLEMNGRSYSELDKSSVNPSTGVNVRFMALPGKRAPVYMKDFFPGAEFECFLEEPSSTRQHNDRPHPNDREEIPQKHHSRKESSKQNRDSIPIVYEDVQVVIPLRSPELASGSQSQRPSKRHSRRESSKHDNNSIPITSDEIPVDVPVACPPPNPAGSSYLSKKRQLADQSTSVSSEIYGHQMTRDITESPEVLHTEPSHQRSPHPPTCSVKVCAIFRKDPLVLGVHLVDGILREGMEFSLASPSNIHPMYGVGGIIVSLQIHQNTYHVIDRSTPHVLDGIGVRVHLNQPAGRSPSFAGGIIPLGVILHCRLPTEQASRPEMQLPYPSELDGSVYNLNNVDRRPQDSSMSPFRCCIEVLKVVKKFPLTLGVFIRKGRLERGMVVVRQASSSHAYSVIGIVESLQIKHESYDVVDHNTAGIAEGIGVRLRPPGESIAPTLDTDISPKDRLYCLDSSDTATDNTPLTSTSLRQIQSLSPVCYVRVYQIFKKNPLVLGVNLLSGVLHVGMVVATPRGPHSLQRTLGRIISLQINRSSYQAVDYYTSDMQTGIGVMIDSSAVHEPLVFGQDYTINSDLHCFTEENCSTFPPASNKVPAVEQPTSTGHSCHLRVLGLLKYQPLVIGVKLLEGKLVLRTPLWLIKLQAPERPPTLEWMGFIASMEINHDSYEIIEKAGPGGDEDIGIAIEVSSVIPAFRAGDTIVGGKNEEENVQL